MSDLVEKLTVTITLDRAVDADSEAELDLMENIAEDAVERIELACGAVQEWLREKHGEPYLLVTVETAY